MSTYLLLDPSRCPSRRNLLGLGCQTINPPSGPTIQVYCGRLLGCRKPTQHVTADGYSSSLLIYRPALDMLAHLLI